MGEQPLGRGVHDVLGERVDASCRAVWLRVELPLRPNGRTAWVRADDVQIANVPTRIVVSVSRRRLALSEDGRVVLRATVAVGSPATPTPTGRYYVNQLLVPSDPNGPFGPGAVGISAFSNVLTGWAQGGPIAIHGTNDLNVKPSQFSTWWAGLAARGVPRKVWLSQYGHVDPFDFRRDAFVNTLHQWFDYWLWHVDNGIMRQPRADIETGPDVWVTQPDWPAPAARP